MTPLGRGQRVVVDCDYAQRTAGGATLLRSIRTGAWSDVLRAGGTSGVGRAGVPRLLVGLLRRPVGAAGPDVSRDGDCDLLQLRPRASRQGTAGGVADRRSGGRVAGPGRVSSRGAAPLRHRR